MKNFQKFRNLLEIAMCDMSQCDFAAKSGISPEHLNRMLNKETINKPSKKILIKIASVAENGISYKDLQDAVDSEDPDFEEINYKTLKNEQAKREFAPSLEEIAQTHFEILASLSSDTSVIASNLNEYVESILDNYKSKCLARKIEPQSISYFICETYDYFGGKFTDDNIKWTSVMFEIMLGDRTAETEMLIYSTTNDNIEPNVIIRGTSMAVKDLTELFGYRGYMLSEHERNETEDKVIENTMTKPFYTNIQSLRKPLSNEEKFKNLFELFEGEPIYKPTCMHGLGFYLNKLDDDFYHFILNHKKTLLKQYYKNPDLFQKSLTKTNEIENSNMADKQKTDELIKIFGDYSDNEEYNAVKIIEYVITEETGFPFCGEVYEFNEEYNDILDKNNAILIEDCELLHNRISEKTVLNSMVRYCKELKVDQMGEIRYVTLETFFKKPKVYKIKASSKNIKSKEDNTNWKDISELPEKNGICEVILKDGRHMNCMFLKTPVKDEDGLWLAYMKSWNHMIAKWKYNE